VRGIFELGQAALDVTIAIIERPVAALRLGVPKTLGMSLSQVDLGKVSHVDCGGRLGLEPALPRTDDNDLTAAKTVELALLLSYLRRATSPSRAPVVLPRLRRWLAD
jgi:hypothetical protein